MQNNPFNIAKTYPGDGTISNPGSQIGQKIGLIDATSNYVTDGRFDIGKFSKLHRQLTVVDGYSATVDIEELMRGGVNVVVQAFGRRTLMKIPDTMKAVLLTGNGDFDKLVFTDGVPTPQPKPDDVLIKVSAAAINNTDINTRIGWYSEDLTGERSVNDNGEKEGST